jgi:hypothetical protein
MTAMTTYMTHENPHAGQGAVLLDIGGDVGALVVTAPPSMVGEEVEILPAGTVGTDADPGHGHAHHHGHDHGHGHRHSHRQHVAVVDRPLGGGGHAPSLVYSELVRGTYDLMPKGTDDVVLTIQIRGGEVTTADWPQSSAQ